MKRTVDVRDAGAPATTATAIDRVAAKLASTRPTPPMPAIVDGKPVVMAPFAQPIAMRAFRESDAAFVFQTWLKTFARAPLPRQMAPRIYNVEQRHVIERLMRTAAIVVAADPIDHDNILGWACGETWGTSPEFGIAGAVIHWLYVPRLFRRRRIASRMLVELVGDDALAGRVPLFYSHLPEPVRGESGNLERNFAFAMVSKATEYNPYLAFAK